MKLSKEILASYANSRSGTYKSIVCHAPFVNLNFEQNGNVRACCYNFTHILGKWPDKTIKEIWHGNKADELRKYVRENELGGGCVECGNMITSGNHHGVRAKYYDEFAPPGIFSSAKYLRNQLTGSIGYPKVMEFELSNNCNLECVMCNGYFSSSIRKNREKLPAIHSPYNDSFVDELEEFIPHLTDAKFLGGEPFMIDIYLKIWERIRKINPGIRIHITTNGTFLTDRVKNLLEGLRAGIILSIDSVSKETYNKIRINGNYDKVMANLEYFREYTSRKNTFISMAACPIVYNWKELPEMLQFCIDKNIALYFNAVFTPVELSLREQPVDEQEKIISFLKANPAPEIKGNKRSPVNLSITAYNDFIKQLEGWISERKNLLNKKEEKLNSAKTTFVSPEKAETTNWSVEQVLNLIFELIEIDKQGYFEKEDEKQQQLSRLLTNTEDDKLASVLKQFVLAYEKYNNEEIGSDIDAKLIQIADLIIQSGKRNEVLYQVSFAPPLMIADFFIRKSIEELSADLNKSNR